MKKVLSTLAIIAFSTMILGCMDKNKSHHASWDYKGEHSPEHWGEIKEYSVCSSGKMQTPINIVPTKDIDLDPIRFYYRNIAVNMTNNGHTLQVNIARGSHIQVDGKQYDLKQFHFHTPSENNINGKSYPLEAHFVHVAKDGSLAVVGVMFQEGKENKTLQKLFSKLPIKSGKTIPVKFVIQDVNNVLPLDREYYTFMGSLTTPPCSENVKWMVLKKPMNISKAQVEAFFNIFGHSNNRPIQETNNREILQ